MGVSFVISVRLFACNNWSTRQIILLQFFKGKSTTSRQRNTILDKTGQNIRDPVHKAVVVLVLAFEHVSLY